MKLHPEQGVTFKTRVFRALNPEHGWVAEVKVEGEALGGAPGPREHLIAYIRGFATRHEALAEAWDQVAAATSRMEHAAMRELKPQTMDMLAPFTMEWRG